MLTGSRGAHRRREKAVMQNGESETQPMISSMTSLKPTVFFFLLRTIRQVTRSLVIVEFKYTFKWMDDVAVKDVQAIDSNANI